MSSSNATCVACATLSCADTPLAIASAIVTFITYLSGVIAAISVYYYSLLNGASELGELVRSFEQSSAQYSRFNDRLRHMEAEDAKNKFGGREGIEFLAGLLSAARGELEQGDKMFYDLGIMDVLQGGKKGWRVPFIGSRRNRRLKLGWEWHSRGKELTVQSFKIKRSIADFQTFLLDSQQEDLAMFQQMLNEMDLNFRKFQSMLGETHELQIMLAEKLVGKDLDAENRNPDATAPFGARHTLQADEQANEECSQLPVPDKEGQVSASDSNAREISPKHSMSNNDEVIELPEKAKATRVSPKQRNSREENEEDVLATLARPPQLPPERDHIFIAEKPQELPQTSRLREKINAIQRRASTWSSSVSGPTKTDESAGKPQKSKERKGSALSGDVPQDLATWKELREGYDDLYDA